MIMGMRLPQTYLQPYETESVATESHSAYEPMLDKNNSSSIEIDMSLNTTEPGVGTRTYESISGEESVEELATRFTMKELKDMCRSKGLSAHGDKKSLALRLLTLVQRQASFAEPQMGAEQNSDVVHQRSFVTDSSSSALGAVSLEL